MTRPRPLIAVVDDEEPVRKALGRLLTSAGLDVVIFASGAAFLESLGQSRPDCVVLDLHMPALDGFEVQNRLLTATDPPVPVVVLTGHDSDETRDRALGHRPVAYLRKPVNDQTLLDAIELCRTSGRIRPV
jgi:FixJ family two-component response regulator